MNKLVHHLDSLPSVYRLARALLWVESAMSPPVRCLPAFSRERPDPRRATERTVSKRTMTLIPLAEDTNLGRKVALKFLSVYLQQDEVAKKRLVREAKSAAPIDHPYICKIYEAGATEVANFIAMEYLEGDTLQKETLCPFPVLSQS